MDTTSSLNTPKGHRRGSSTDERRRAGLHRQLTAGPLGDLATEEDPLSIPTANLGTAAPSPRSTKTSRYTPTPATNVTLSPPSSVRTQSRSPVRPATTSKDFGYLTKPENFHPLPVNTIPQAFLNSSNAPASTATVDELLQKGQFYAAAITSAQQLTRLPRPVDPALAFSLLEIRLKCLLLIDQSALAAAESKVFGDLSNPFYQDLVTGSHLVPWDLRVLCVRLQALGFGEWRRGVMSYYLLAQEARAELSRLRKLRASESSSPATAEGEDLWAARLQDLAVRVASALVEMNDCEAAVRHLRSLELDPQTSEPQRKLLLQMQALVWLKIGDIRAAQRCVRQMVGAVSTPSSPTIAQAPWTSTDTSTDKVAAGSLIALFRMGEGEFSAAAHSWQTLLEVEPSNGMIVQNLAICLLYTDRLIEARKLLEDTLEQSGNGATFKSFLFNLCTIYELCTEGAVGRKERLAAELAALQPDAAGWDRATTDFKL